MPREILLVTWGLFFAGCAGKSKPSNNEDGTSDDTPPNVWGWGEPDIDWLEDGSPTIAEPVIDWLDAGMPPVARPQLTPCPEGWREVAVDILEVGDQIVCDPWPETGLEVCAGVETHLPGEEGCRPVGSACPEGDWPESADGSALVADLYVSPGGAGDGLSPDSPLGSLEAALDAVAGLWLGDGVVPVVALSKGSHAGGLSLDQDLSLVGACAEETWITDSIVAEGASLGFQDLSLTEANAVAVQTNGGDLSMRGVAVLGSKLSGLLTEDTEVVLSDVVVRGTWGSSSTNSKVGAVWVTGGSLEASGLEIDDSWLAGLRINKAQATVNGLLVREVEGANDVDFDIGGTLALAGAGVDNWEGTLELRDSVVTNTDWCAVRTYEGSTRLEEMVVHDLAPDTAVDGFGNRGLCASAGHSTLTGSRMWVRGIANAAVVISLGGGPGEEAELDLSDMVAQDLGREEHEKEGVFLTQTSSSLVSARIERVAMTDLQNGGLIGIGDVVISDVTVARLGCRNEVQGALWILEGTGSFERLIGVDVGCPLVAAGYQGETSLSVSDMYFRGGDPPYWDTAVQSGISAGPWGPATLNVERALVEDADMAGVEVNEATLNLTDVIIRGGEPPEDRVGVGGWLHDEADGTWERVVFEGHHAMGVAVEAGSRLTLRDVRITDTSSAVQDGRGGFGLWVDEGGTVDAERLAISGSKGAGIWSSNAALSLTDMLVSGTEPAGCYPTSCDEAAASGVVLSGDVSLSRFLVSSDEGAGVQTISGAIELDNGLSRLNSVGFDDHGGRVTSSALGAEGNDLDEGDRAAEVSAPLSPADLGMKSVW